MRNETFARRGDLNLDEGNAGPSRGRLSAWAAHAARRVTTHPVGVYTRYGFDENPHIEFTEGRMDSQETAATIATESGWTFGRVVRAMLGVELIVLLALAQVIFAGYRMGVGN